MTTRRDAFVSSTPVPAQSPRLSSVVDTADITPYGLAAINCTTWIFWAERWSPTEREHYLKVMEREFPDLVAEVIDHLQKTGRPTA